MSVSLDLARRALANGHFACEDLRAARIIFADAISCMLAATQMEPAIKPFHDLAKSAGTGPATLLAGGKSNLADAALANGALVHALDFEDTFDEAGLHPHASLVPTLLALAEGEEKTLGDVLAALRVGGDFACRIGLAMRSDPAKRGWYHPPMIGCAGAVIGAAHLLKLSPEQTVAALSLAQTQFSLTDALKGDAASDLRAVREGLAAQAAVKSVLLARVGAIGTSDPLFERGGLFPLLTGAEPDLSAFDALGSQYLGDQVSIKFWPCCRGTHRAIQFALDLRDQGILAGRILHASFRVNPPDDMLFTPLKDRQKPATAIGAKFSIPYCFAYALIHGAPSLNSFDGVARAQREVLALATKITMDTCESGTVPSAQIHFEDGTSRDMELPKAPTLRANETSFADISGKVQSCVQSAEKSNACADVLLGLETTPMEMEIHQFLASLI